MLTLIVLVIAIVVAAVVLSNETRRRRLHRIGAVAGIAGSVGFSFTADDRDRIEDLPFWLFRRGHSRKLHLVISGTHNGRALQIFDYSYTVGSGRNQQNYPFTCAILTIPAACPALRLSHENFPTRIGDDLGPRDVELEYDAFNRRFRIKCDDRRFAFSLFDGEMMQWLLDAAGFESLEIVGPWAMLARHPQPPEQWLQLGVWLDDFVHRIPAVAFSTYPPQ